MHYCRDESFAVSKNFAALYSQSCLIVRVVDVTAELLLLLQYFEEFFYSIQNMGAQSCRC